MQLEREIRVGLVAWNSLPAIVSSDSKAGNRVFGGMETQTWTLAKHLAKRANLHVRVYVEAESTHDHGNPWPASVDGVELRVCVDRFRAIRNEVSKCVNFRTRRLKKCRPSLLWMLPWLLLTRPFRRRDPQPCHADHRLLDEPIDFWIAFGNNASTSRVIATAHAKSVPCAVAIMSNDDLDPGLAWDEAGSFEDASLPDYESDYGEAASVRRFVIARADHVWCQSELQADRAEKFFRRSSVLLRNPIHLDDWAAARSKIQPTAVLWMGRYDDFHKRPLLMMDVAKRCPEIAFTMIANALDADIEAEVRRQCPPNVTLVDRVAFADLPQVYARARVFASTGDPKQEGFPNVLLQAAATGTPTVSLSDYGQFLQESGAGVSCDGSIDKMVEQVQRLWARPTIDQPAVDEYLRKHYDADAIAGRVADIIETSVA